MRKFFIVAILLLAVLSCAKHTDTPPTPPTVPSTPPVTLVPGPDFTAVINNSTNPESSVGYRTFLLSWSEGDLFSVFYNSAGNSKYKYVGRTGVTSGKIVSVNDSSDDFQPINYAIYPYAEENKLDNDVLYFTLPAQQNYKANTLDMAANTMVAECAEGDNNKFEFKNVSGYICLHVYGATDLKSIELKGNNNEILAGEASYDLIGEEIHMSGKGKTITLNCDEAVALGATKDDATFFWIALPPTLFTNGVTITLTDSEGNTHTEIIDTELNIERNTVYDKFIKFEDEISKSQAEDIIKTMGQEWLTKTKNKYANAVANNVFINNGLQLKIWAKTYGEKPADGRSLYISMHGGGGVPAKDNDAQWDNQKQLYTPTEGVYVAPRAPWNEWNMWFKPGLDELFEQLIQAAVATWDVNPDKVYLMGYSAGGDGAYKMGPRMADKWAAVSMMAGHPNGASMLSLRNTPFSIWVGANDADFNRNTIAAEYGKMLDDLQAADPDGYIHSTHIVEGKGHWMDNEDRAAVPWMAQYKRNPYPSRVVWCQSEVKRTSFYWISIDEAEYAEGATIVAEIEGNTINISHCDYENVSFYLNDEMVNLDEPVVITYGDTELFNGMVKRSREVMESSLAKYGDIRNIFPAVVNVKIPSNSNTNNNLENPTGGGIWEW